MLLFCRNDKVPSAAVSASEPTPGIKGSQQVGSVFGFSEAVASTRAVAAALEHALLEERRELADIVLGEVETAVCVGFEGRAWGCHHHPEQVPQITLQKKQSHANGTGNGEADQTVNENVAPPSGSGAQQPSARLCFQTASLGETREMRAVDVATTHADRSEHIIHTVQSTKDEWTFVDSNMWLFQSVSPLDIWI